MSARKGVDFKKTNKKAFISNKIESSLKKVDINAQTSDGENRIDKYFNSVKSVQESQENVPIDPNNANQSEVTSIEGSSENHQSCLEQPTDDSQDVKFLKKEIQVLKKNLQDAKSLLRKTNQVNMEKDMQLKKFELQSDPKVTPNHLFGEFSPKFEADELATIRSVGPGKKNDSRFILNITRFLYKNGEKSKLKNRSVVGRKYKGETKHEISFEKKAILENMFQQRVDNEESIVTDEHAKRMKNLNSLIRSAIHNILKSITKRAREEDEDDDYIQLSKHAKTNDGILLNSENVD